MARRVVVRMHELGEGALGVVREFGRAEGAAADRGGDGVDARRHGGDRVEASAVHVLAAGAAASCPLSTAG